MDFTVLNWNIGGAKYLELKEKKRNQFRNNLNDELNTLIRKHKPHVVTLQEVVRYGSSSQDAEDIVDQIDDYRYYSFPLIDTYRLSAEAKWKKVKQLGNWPEDSYFAQGNAFLFRRKDVLHFPVLSLSDGNESIDLKRNFVEQINMERGIYFGERGTEPRAGLVAHFVFKPDKVEGKPLDVFVINLHLTTLMMEREGVTRTDTEASRIRMAQLDTIFHGIISEYNIWRAQGYLLRGKPRKKKTGETYNRYPPVWILAGDFNFTPESVEYETIRRHNYIDVIPNKGTGTKAKGMGHSATLTVDYIFAGPQFISLDTLITGHEISKNGPPDYTVLVSDHFPLFATIPLAIESILL